MKIAVILRQVPDLIEPLEIADDGKRLEFDQACFLVNESDDHAFEQALLIREAKGADLCAVAFGFGDVETTLYAAAAKGVEKLLVVPWAAEEPPSTAVAAAMLAEVVRSLGPDLVLLGCQACDELEGALGARLAVLLGWPYLGVIRGVEAAGEPGSVVAWKEFPGAAKARMRVRLPAVLGILAAEQPPRYVPVSRIRAAMKSARFDPVEIAPPEIASGVVVTGLSFPERGEGAEMLEGSEAEVADRIAEILLEKGVL